MVESPSASEVERGTTLSIDQLPPDIFHSETKALLVPSDSSPADNLKRLVQECGVAPHKISELLHELPPRNLTDKLVDLYFTGMCVRSMIRRLSSTELISFTEIGQGTLYLSEIFVSGTIPYILKGPRSTRTNSVSSHFFS